MLNVTSSMVNRSAYEIGYSISISSTISPTISSSISPTISSAISSASSPDYDNWHGVLTSRLHGLAVMAMLCIVLVTLVGNTLVVSNDSSSSDYSRNSGSSRYIHPILYIYIQPRLPILQLISICLCAHYYAT